MKIKENYKSGSLGGGSLEAPKGPKGRPRNTSDRHALWITFPGDRCAAKGHERTVPTVGEVDNY